MIRKIKTNDYERLKELVYQVHQLHYSNRSDIYVDGDPLPLAYFNEMLDADDAFNYVYEEEGKICGLLMAQKKKVSPIPIIKQRTIYFIEDIVVDDSCRRRGIGKKLYNFLLERSKTENVDAIELNVWAFNEPAIKFYESLGMSVKNMRFEQVLNSNNIDLIK